MAGSPKEAMVLVVDVGPLMAQAPPGHVTPLENAKDAISMLLQRKMFSQSKDEVALILLGTQETANELAGTDDESYLNITVARPLGQPDFDLLEFVKNDIVPGPVSADFVDAIVVALDLVRNQTMGKKFETKRIVLFSNLAGEFTDDQLEGVINGMKALECEFNLIGLSLDDDDEDGDMPDQNGAGPPRKERTPQQRAGTALIRHVIEEVDGVAYSESEALQMLSFFQKRNVRAAPWKVMLEVGTNLKIPVRGFIRVKECKPNSFKKVHARTLSKDDIHTTHEHRLNDDEETPVESTIDGYRYGNTIVPFSTDDESQMKFKTDAKCFDVLGFTRADNVKRQYYMGDSVRCFVAEEGDEPAAVALSAFIHALYETNMVAIVRYVYNKNSAPKVAFLTPHIKPNYECLLCIMLPFMEDMRKYTFSSLHPNNKNQPSDDQLSAVDDLIDNMNLVMPDKDEDGKQQQYLKPKLTFNPHLQRLYQCLSARALNPDDPQLPPPNQTILNYLQPQQDLLTQAQPCVDKIKAAFPLEVVTKKKEETTAQNIFGGGDDAEPAAKKPRLDTDAGGDGGLTMAGLAQGPVTEVGSVRPLEDFRAMISRKDDDKFMEASAQLQKRIEEIVMESFGDQFYGKAMECLLALRKESAKLGEPDQFNTFLRGFKETLFNKGRKDFWDCMVREKVTLISSEESSETSVSKEEAGKFLEIVEQKTEEPEEMEEAEAEDLLAMM
ncbi:X-ray repair cross-complementing protein 5-like [Branchiostoma floridae]|uniref:ATP-dependent DNA helicase II subunit 2 n=1 Tax=Branchiostoma floridae TaxID=7739 RepID=A0A9J7HK90_BRAFL|nr:X-ray repair cross-complementing protein 5-like [Branchiostoma floridae]